MRIALVIATLRLGGAERVVSTLANHWAAQGRTITIFTLAPLDVQFFALHQGIQIVGLDALGPENKGVLAHGRTLVTRIFRLYKALRAFRPDVVVSALPAANTAAVMAGRLTNTPVIVTEHSDVGMEVRRQPYATVVVSLYLLAARILVLTPYAQRTLPRMLRPRSRVMPNPVQLDQHVASSRQHSADKGLIVALGRLAPVKNFDLLVRSFATLAPDFPNWTLKIHGEGPERQALEKSIKHLGLEGRVMLPGATPEVARALAAADVYVQPSQREGFSLGVCEAMASGLPVVAFDGSESIRHLLDEGRLGKLVPQDDVEALAAAMKVLIQSPDERQRLGRVGQRAAERFSTPHVASQWDEIFQTIASTKEGHQ